MKNGSSLKELETFLEVLEHPFKEEIQLLRKIITAVHEEIGEQIKWKAPSFNFKGEDFATFNLHAKHRVHLIFHHPLAALLHSDLLVGDDDDRRMAYFTSSQTIETQKTEIEAVIRQLIGGIGSKYASAPIEHSQLSRERMTAE